jgi:hypothetical protein
MARLFEHRAMPVLSFRAFAARMTVFAAAAVAVTAAALGAGMWGYHHYEGLPWLDAFLNAAMILGGMGQVDVLRTPGGKLFAGLYALACGFVLIAVSGLFLAPVFHRVLHRFHVPDEKD